MWFRDLAGGPDTAPKSGGRCPPLDPFQRLARACTKKGNR